MTPPLGSRIALVTGGRRIGQVVAEELARAGADVALSYRTSRQEAEETAARVRALGRRAIVQQADVSRPADCAALAEAIERQLGGLDIVVNMASTYVARPLGAIDEQSWRADIDNNLSSAFLVTHAVLPLLRRHSTAHVVNFTDWLPASGRPRYAGFVGVLRRQGRRQGAHRGTGSRACEGPHPGQRDRTGPDRSAPGTRCRGSRRRRRSHAARRWGGELEIARAVMLLVTTQFITGETLRVDGGRHVR